VTSLKLRLEVGTFTVIRITCFSLEERQFCCVVQFDNEVCCVVQLDNEVCCVVQFDNEVCCILFVSGFVLQRLKFLGILQHHARYSYQFTAEGTRWQKEISCTFTFSQFFYLITI
jgi:hypothetical protein